MISYHTCNLVLQSCFMIVKDIKNKGAFKYMPNRPSLHNSHYHVSKTKLYYLQHIPQFTLLGRRIVKIQWSSPFSLLNTARFTTWQAHNFTCGHNSSVDDVEGSQQKPTRCLGVYSGVPTEFCRHPSSYAFLT